MKTLREALQQEEMSGVAIGHFNISDLVALKAAFEDIRDLNVPVVIGVSAGERQFIGVRQAAALERSRQWRAKAPLHQIRIRPRRGDQSAPALASPRTRSE